MRHEIPLSAFEKKCLQLWKEDTFKLKRYKQNVLDFFQSKQNHNLIPDYLDDFADSHRRPTTFILALKFLNYGALKGLIEQELRRSDFYSRMSIDPSTILVNNNFRVERVWDITNSYTAVEPNYQYSPVLTPLEYLALRIDEALIQLMLAMITNNLTDNLTDKISEAEFDCLLFNLNERLIKIVQIFIRYPKTNPAQLNNFNKHCFQRANDAGFLDILYTMTKHIVLMRNMALTEYNRCIQLLNRRNFAAECRILFSNLYLLPRKEKNYIRLDQRFMPLEMRTKPSRKSG